MLADHAQKIMRTCFIFKTFDVTKTGRSQLMNTQSRTECELQDKQDAPMGHRPWRRRVYLRLGISKNQLHLFQRKGPVVSLEFGLGEFDAGNILKVIVFQVVLFDQPLHARGNDGFGVIDAFGREHPLRLIK